MLTSGFTRAALAALACTLLLPAAGQAAPATLKGKLTGVKLPGAGKGVASVRAMELNSTVVLGARYTNGKGAFNLKVPAGKYGLLASVVPFGGGKVIEKVVGRVRLTAGKTRSVKLAVKKAKKKKKGKRGKGKRRGRRRARKSAVPDGFGNVSVDYPAVAVHPFDSTEPGLGKGIHDMLITDLLEGIGGKPSCKAVIVERTRIDTILKELALSKGPLVDPGTKLKSGRITKDNAKVTGTVSKANGVYTATATYTDLKTGQSTTFTESSSDFFEVERKLADKLGKHICDPPDQLIFPQRLDGTWTRTFGNSYRGSWTVTVEGTASYVRNPFFGPELNGVTSIPYEVESASITWTASGSQQADSPPGCVVTFSGSGTDAWTANWGEVRLDLEEVTNNPYAPKPEPEPWYYSIRAGGDPQNAPMYTVSTSGECNAADTQEPIPTDYLYIGSPGGFPPGDDRNEIQKSVSGFLLNGTRHREEGGWSTDDTWSFTGSGSG